MTTCPLSDTERARLAADCLEIAERGAATARRGFRSGTTVREKTAHDIVTPWDEATQEQLLALLAARHPGVAVVAEEGGDPNAALPAGLAFAVDPIDGTTNFAHGHPVWCVSIGVLFDGEPVAGAVVAPCLDTRWHGYRQGARGVALRNGEPCAVSRTDALDQALVATGFPPERGDGPYDNFASFVAVKRRARAVRRCGSAAIDIAFVADGTYDGYWERRLHVWDSAAAAALVLAAGGRVTAIDGGAPDLRRGHITVTNGVIHDALVAAVHADPGPIVGGAASVHQ